LNIVDSALQRLKERAAPAQHSAVPAEAYGGGYGASVKAEHYSRSAEAPPLGTAERRKRFSQAIRSLCGTPE
jgi:hypothetical protein